MNCNKAEVNLIGYLLNMLTQEERKNLETHFSSCRKCQRRLEELQKVKSLFKKWKPVSPPPDLKQKVLDNISAQKLIEEKTSAKFNTGGIPMEKMMAWLKQRVNSEQIRIYKMLTDFLGQKKGKEVFDYYLEKEITKQLFAPTKEVLFNFQAIAKSLGLSVEVKRLEGGVIKETIRNCSYFTIAKELGANINPCEAICLKQAKIKEKFQPVKVDLIKKMPNKDYECIFIQTPLEQKPF